MKVFTNLRNNEVAQLRKTAVANVLKPVKPKDLELLENMNWNRLARTIDKQITTVRSCHHPRVYCPHCDSRYKCTAKGVDHAA